MDIPSILIKITGLILLIWTLYSIYKHVKEKMSETKTLKKSNNEEVQSLSEQLLNNALLYLWLSFMLVFSVGMIVNN